MKGAGSNVVVIAANNGDIGGGETMLLALAEELVKLGIAVMVVGPSNPAELINAARDRHFETVALDVTTRLEYLSALRNWDRHHREGLLWCNGLLPAIATAGHPNRVVHLHQRPHGNQRPLANIARWGSLATLVPSTNMAIAIHGSTVFHNWVAGLGDIKKVRLLTNSKGPTRIGFLGRPSTDKGVEVLAAAMSILERQSPGGFQLVLGGEPRFVGKKSRNSVEAALAKLGDVVERTGWVAPKEFFERIDVLVCPSIWAEPFGLVVAESMSARIPVVVTDAGALPEVVGREHPWIARAGDPEDLARIVVQAVKGDAAVVDRAYQRWNDMWSPKAGRARLALILQKFDIPVEAP